MNGSVFYAWGLGARNFYVVILVSVATLYIPTQSLPIWFVNLTQHIK